MTAPAIDLGLGKAPGRTRVVAAMSGGVDSSVVAGLLAEAGYEVVGITLQLYDHGAAVRRAGACCAGQDIHDARRVAERLGIPHYVLNYQRRFRVAVIERFAEAYARGETPIPCVLCNQTVKFTDLLDTARDLGADALATGHYVRRIEAPDGPALLRGADAARDQSYFLFATTRAQLRLLRFPLGGMGKAQVRAEAARLGLPVAAKPDSQDICFVPEGRYDAVVARLRPGAARPGEIVDVAGRVLGRHRGLGRYTVGQRRGLGLGNTGAPAYVVRIDAAANRLVVGPRAALARRRLALGGLNWLGPGAQPEAGAAVSVKLRSTQAPAPARVFPAPEGRAEVALDSPAHGVAPGQACVFYDGERLLGGGWIAGEDAEAAA